MFAFFGSVHFDGWLLIFLWAGVFGAFFWFRVFCGCVRRIGKSGFGKYNFGGYGKMLC